MQPSPASFIPILFKVLFGFVGLNIIVNLILLYNRPLRITKLVAIYWPCVFLHFIVQGHFQTGDLQVALGYSAVYATTLMMGMIAFEAIGRPFPLKNYLLLMIPVYPLTLWVHSLGYSFTAVALPFAVAVAIPLMHSSYYLLGFNKNSSTRLQKVLGIIYFLNAIHSLNFAFFRMDPGAQLWGWLVSYCLCDLLAILLPSVALEQYSMTEKARLQTMVDEKTMELNKSLATSDTLFKVLVHDISNPMMVFKGYLHLIKENPEKRDFLIEKLQASQTAMEKMIQDVKSMYQQRHKTKNLLGPVVLEDCFKEVTSLFEASLKHKNVSLKINNHLLPNTLVKANHTSLTHSVLSNLISNSLKFTFPDSKIEITVSQINDNIVLEVKDEGPGIPTSVIDDVMLNKELTSSDGTMGEKGSGLGLSIAKSFVDSYGGQIEFDSSLMHTVPKDFGTNVRITLDRA